MGSWARSAPAAVVAIAIAVAACGGDTATPPPTSPPAVTASASPGPTFTPGPAAPVEVAGRATFYGPDPGDGLSAIAPGDFNGDGVMDIVLAAAFADGPGNSRPDSGEAYLFLGPLSADSVHDTLAGDQDLVVFGAQAGDQLGRAVTSGDLNGDGFTDIVLGAPFADAPGREDTGAVYVFFGSPGLGQPEFVTLDLAAAEASLVVYGADDQDLAGFALHAADVTGDGIDDLIIGALWADGPDNERPDGGEAYIILGGALQERVDLARNAPAVTVYGAEANERMGETVGAGDVNGDGVHDLLVVAAFAPGTRPDSEAAGQTYVLLSPLPAVIDIAAGGAGSTVHGADNGDQLGHSLAAGDADGDGIDDIFLGAVSSEGSGNAHQLAGEAMLFAGRDRWPPHLDAAAGDHAMAVYGGSPEDRLGRSVAAGDLNGDGLTDLLAAAPGVDLGDGARVNAGEVYVFLGRRYIGGDFFPAGRNADVVLEGLDPGDVLGQGSFGRPGLRAVDMDGDGLDDIIVSAPAAAGPSNERPGAGEVYVLFTRVAG